jgi:hypothetical protein
MKSLRLLFLSLLAVLLCLAPLYAAASKNDAAKKPGTQGELTLKIYLDGTPLKDIQAIQVDKSVYIPLKELGSRLKVPCDAESGAVTIQGKKAPCATIEKDGVIYAESQALKALFPYRITVNRAENVVALWSPSGAKPYQPEPGRASQTGPAGSPGSGGPGDPGGMKLAVTSAKRGSDSTYADRVIMECRVENFTKQYARGVVVSMVIKDPSGVSGFDGSNTPREYGRYTAGIAELKPGGVQTVIISTGLARPVAFNEGGRTITMELVGPNKDFSAVKVNLDYYFEVNCASLTDN